MPVCLYIICSRCRAVKINFHSKSISTSKWICYLSLTLVSNILSNWRFWWDSKMIVAVVSRINAFLWKKWLQQAWFRCLTTRKEIKTTEFWSQPKCCLVFIFGGNFCCSCIAWGLGKWSFSCFVKWFGTSSGEIAVRGNISTQTNHLLGIIICCYFWVLIWFFPHHTTFAEMRAKWLFLPKIDYL